MMQTPSLGSLAPRRFAGQRPNSPQGDGSPQANGAPQQPKPTPSMSTARPPAPQAQTTQPQQPQTFAQMQAAGIARPAPAQLSGGAAQGVGDPSIQWQTDPITGASVKPGDLNTRQPDGSYRSGTGQQTDPAGTEHSLFWDNGTLTGDTMQRPGGPVTAGPEMGFPGPGVFGGPAAGGASGSMTPGVGGGLPTTGGTQLPPTQQTPGQTQVPGGSAGGSQSNAFNTQLQQALQNALGQPSRYNTPEMLQERDALTATLNQQFGSQQKQLDEEMARRGIGASSIAAGYNGDLKGQQANALATMNAGLLKDSAANHAADQNAAFGNAQNFANMGLQSSQFQQSLAQALGIATMGDKTANRGIDAQAALANNDLMLRVLAALGLPSGMPSDDYTRKNNGQAGDPPGTIRDAQGNVVRWGAGNTSTGTGSTGTPETGGIDTGGAGFPLQNRAYDPRLAQQVR